MAQLQFKNVNAPNLSGTANILQQASNQLTSALSGGAKILQDYTKGQQDKADGKVVAEIAKLSTEEDINSFLNSETVQGKPLSPAMQQAVLGLRKNLVGLQADRAAIDSTEVNTDGTRQRNEQIGLEGELLGAKVAGQLQGNRLTSGQADAVGINNRTLNDKNLLGLEQQRAGVGQTLASTLLTQENARSAGINNETLGQKNRLGLDEQRAGIRSTDAGTLLTGARAENQQIQNLTQAEEDRLGLQKDRADIRSTDASTLLTGANTQTANINNRTLDTRNLSEIDGILARTRGTNAQTSLTSANTREQNINNSTLRARNQADLAGVQARTASTIQGTTVAKESEARTAQRFQNSQSDRKVALAETAENKQKARVRDDAALTAFQDPNNVSDSDVAKSLASSGQFKRPDGTTDSTAIFNAINRAKGLSSTGAGAILSPYVQPSATVDNAITLAGLGTEEAIRSSTQGRLLADAKSYESDPAGKLTEEFGIVREIFNTPKESKDKLRVALNEVAAKTGVSVDKVAVAFRESFQSSAPWFSTNDPANIFDIDAATEYVNNYLSPEAVARHNEFKVVTRSSQQELEKKQTALTRVEKQIAKSGANPSADLLLKRETLMNEIFSGGGLSAASPQIVPQVQSNRASDILGATPTDLNQPPPYEPRYEDEATADYVQQLLLEEARKAGVVQ